MVTAIAKPFAAPVRIAVESIPRESSNGVVAERRTVCPRCESRLSIAYFEPECIQCGYADYSYRPVNGVKKGIINSGTRYVIRYVGEFSTLSNTLAHIKLRSVRNRVVYGVRCPFCGTGMEQTSLSGKRREVREERYKCIQGHRVSLTPGKNGSLGWK